MASTSENYDRNEDTVEETYGVVLTTSALVPTASHRTTGAVSTRSQHGLKGFILVMVMFSLCLVQFLSALDITIVATALPTIAKQLSVTSAQYTWIGSAYNLASTASTPLWARCSDIWGRKPLLLGANVAFMAGSLVASLAHSAAMLIAGRTLQGLGGGGIVIMVSIIIADLFPLPERAKYYGFSAVIWAIASALGPVLGGIFTQTIGWRWCFFINLPFDAASLISLWFILRIETPKQGLIEGLRTFDWIGSFAVVGGTICFLCGLEGGASASQGWKSAYTISLLIVGIVLLCLFVIYEIQLAPAPLVPMRVFVGRVNVAAITAAMAHSFVFIAYDYFLPLYFQVILRASPVMSGVYLLALVTPLSLTSAATGILIKKTGNYHYAAWCGSVVMAIGTGLFITFDSRFVQWKIIVYQMVAGIGAGPLFLSPMLALQNHLRKEDIAAGTSAFTFLRSISTSISIVIGGVVLQKGIQSSTLTDIALVRGADLVEKIRNYTQGLSTLWIFYTAIAGLVVLSSLLISKPVTDEKVDEEKRPQ